MEQAEVLKVEWEEVGMVQVVVLLVVRALVTAATAEEQLVETAEGNHQHDNWEVTQNNSPLKSIAYQHG